ncbi:MAG TPA: hypothetical protein P5081_12235 [Phycisphaerae bacterium]|nr:hypothetical protein [Phycisphaerae bacterium]
MHRNPKSVRSFALLTAALIVAGTAVPALAGPIFSTETSRISFQALLTDGVGDPLPDGPVNLSFTIYHPVIGPIEGPIVVATTVSGGVVNVMVPVSRSSWDGGARELGVSVNNDPELSPRIPLVSVPHAFRVDRVENEELTNDVVLGQPGDAGTMKALDSAGTTTVETDGAAGRVKTIAGTVSTTLLGNSLSGGGFMEIYQASGALGLSLDGDQSVGTSGGDEGGAIKGYNGQGVFTFSLTADDNGNSASLLTMRDHITTTVRLNAKGAGGGGGLTLFNDGGVETLQLDGDEDNAGEMIIYDANGVGTLHADGDDGSNGARLALGDGAREIFRFDAGTPGASVPGGPQMHVWNAAGSEIFRLNGSGTGNDPELSLRNSAGEDVFSFITDDDDSGRLVMKEGVSTRVILDADNDDDGGRLELRWANTTAAVLDAWSVNGGAGLELYKNGTSGARLLADDGSGGSLTLRRAGAVAAVMDGDDGNDSGRITLYQAGQTAVVIDANQNSGNGAYMELRDASGNAKIILDTDVNGDARVITEELQITGGSDLSEQFEIRSATGVEAGMVVCIDPARPGSLVVSGKTHDRTVAGIVSGAGGVRTGMMMGQQGSIADGRYPVALTGRVYCKVDTSKGDIQPGDLLTTSDKPGCCMKVTDHDAAQGAIIGKAMTSPSNGLVLVLVSLQ